MRKTLCVNKTKNSLLVLVLIEICFEKRGSLGKSKSFREPDDEGITTAYNYRRIRPWRLHAWQQRSIQVSWEWNES